MLQNTDGVLVFPVDDRPRERMAIYGAGALSDAELVAVLLRTGTQEKSAMSLATELTADGGLYKHLAGIRQLKELTKIKGLGMAKASTILAAIEIGRRLATAKPLERCTIACPGDGVAFLMPRLRYLQKEQFLVILLNSKNRVIGMEIVSEGSLTNSVVHPREVFQPAILQHAAAIVVAHNHPSGDPRPSPEDREITRMLKEAGVIMNIPVLDHIIIGDGTYFSFLEEGAI